MDVTVVIPTLDARELLHTTLESLERQTSPAQQVVVVDNASRDGTGEMVRRRFPSVELVTNKTNLGFGRAVNAGAARARGDLLVLLNNDLVCEPGFLEAIREPFADPAVGMVAGVLTQMRAPGRIDSAGIELDVTLGSSDYLSDEPLAALDGARDPVGPCGGAAAYRLDAYHAVGGFDERLFAYWEDVDLALALQLAGWRCRLAPEARAEHRHGATLGAGSPRQRELDAFGRAYVLAKYGVLRRSPLRALQTAIRDWPALAVHLLVRRESGPIRSRLQGGRAGRHNRDRRGPPPGVVTVGLGETLRRQVVFLEKRRTGRLPEHYHDTGPRTAGPHDS
jgi:GT2 family glycosyltransferase